MDLSKLFTSTIEEKTNEIFSKYKALIDLASPDAREKAIKLNLNNLSKERQDLFSQKIDPEDKYHYIQSFAGYYTQLEGLYNSFEKEFVLAKGNMLDAFKDHGYLPKIKIFLKQNDEEIIKKLALYFAYGRAIEKFQDLLSQQEVVKTGTKKTEQKFPFGIDPTNINETYQSLFKHPELIDIVDGFTKKLFFHNGTWKGHKGKKQEVAALIRVFIMRKIIAPKSEIYAVKVFCVRYKIIISTRSMRTKGYAFTDAYDYFKDYFLRYYKNPDILNME